MKMTEEQKHIQDRIRYELTIAKQESSKAYRWQMLKYFDWLSTLPLELELYYGHMYNGKPYTVTVEDVLIGAKNSWGWSKS